MSQKLWGGRFAKKADAAFERFSASYQWDHRLLPHDLAIDKAHVKALRAASVLTVAEAARLIRALERLERLNAKGSLALDKHAEDVHSAVHQKLKAIAGDLADRLHTGRSRNDLVAQSSRLYCKEAASGLIKDLTGLQRQILSQARKHQTTLVAGMTHMQNAQVLSLAHVWLGYIEMLERSKEQLAVARGLSDVCVLGSGALAGTTFKLKQSLIAKELKLSRVTRNSYDVAGDRDYIVSFLFALTLLGTHLSRIAEDMMLWQTRAFGLLDIDEAFCTGSSMMPQKKNADFVELMRGASGVFFSDLCGILATLKGLPTSYNRDLQWDKSYLFDGAETAEALVDILTRVFATLRIRSEAAQAMVTDESLYATDFADYLVKKKVPFKTAHDQVGRIVAFAESQELPISKIGLDLLRQFAPATQADIYGLFDAGQSVRQKSTQGSTNPVQVAQQLKFWKRQLR